MPVIFSALGTLAAGLLPASKTLAGFAASAAHGSGGLLKALQDKLHAWEDTEFALQEKVGLTLELIRREGTHRHNGPLRGSHPRSSTLLATCSVVWMSDLVA